MLTGIFIGMFVRGPEPIHVAASKLCICNKVLGYERIHNRVKTSAIYNQVAVFVHCDGFMCWTLSVLSLFG